MHCGWICVNKGFKVRKKECGSGSFQDDKIHSWLSVPIIGGQDACEAHEWGRKEGIQCGLHPTSESTYLHCTT